MCPGFSVLDFLMQLPDIMRNRQQNTLCFYIRFSTVSESSEACILFQITKASLGLDTPVHPQQNPLFTGNPLDAQEEQTEEVRGTTGASFTVERDISTGGWTSG